MTYMQVASTRSAPPAGRDDHAAPTPARYRLLAALAWAGGSLAAFALFLRISLGSAVNSDGASNALQGWDLLHGHLLLHGWQIGDANFYFLELPLNAITAAFFGLGDFAAHAASALTYLFVAICAAALAVTGSRGPARAVRCAVVVMVLAAPLLAVPSIWLVLEEPDHIGTSVFMLGSFLLIDRVPSRRYTVPLLCAVLVAGQFSDMTVRYVAVPAVVAVCGYRALVARRLRSPDAALAAAALASVPLAAVTSLVFRLLGGFTADAPAARIAPPRLWPHQAMLTWANIRQLFGAVHLPDTKLGILGFGLGVTGLAAAVFGLAWVARRWRRASRAEQLLCAAIVCNLGIDLTSTLARHGYAHELAAVLPCGAVLAARAVVPARIMSAPTAFVAVAATALGALLTLTSAATLPIDQQFNAPMTAWLQAHGLRYGLAGYWLGASSTVQSGGKVQIRPILVGRTRQGYQVVDALNYEDNSSWYDPALHDATFVVADSEAGISATGFEQAFERAFGEPAAARRLGPWIILIYRTNLLRLLGHPGSPAPWSAPRG